jgi:preprotein translocase subunit SecG
MTTKTLAIVVIVAALVIAGVLVMHGKGHAALARWMPSLHGGSGH